MKYSTVFFTVLFMAVIAVNCKTEDLRTEYCNEESRASAPKGKCVLLLCAKDNSRYSALTCPLAQCPGKILKLEEDLSKPAPYCCPKITCEDGTVIGN